ncbi:MAG: 16S rRNA (uracil(1498)-N(3))-methyltransferase [Dysgonamonadaceae bacterium]|jgi:16S rRNA (uracil1498-N3)-methyltransferase|nr:16S rRNA (uracil(1498)-N(3))-methyltransferase [Dysgonamonadaceae bacterium]
MILFYAPDILTTPVLPETESQHCIRVLRKREGNQIDIVDGKGHWIRASITEPHPKQCRVEIIETRKACPNRKNRIEIALAPTKNTDRTEWFVEKATETGIDRISFLRTRFSERKELKVDRMIKISVSAMKQSLQATLPDIDEMIDFGKLVTRAFNGLKFIAHCYPQEKKQLSSLYKKGEDVLILIGPEGDFSEEEVSLALQNGFRPISLGETRLRTETAALTACQTIHILNQL